MNQPNTVTLSLQTYTELYDFKATIKSKGMVVDTCRQTSYYIGNALISAHASAIHVRKMAIA